MAHCGCYCIPCHIGHIEVKGVQIPLKSNWLYGLASIGLLEPLLGSETFDVRGGEGEGANLTSVSLAPSVTSSYQGMLNEHAP